MTMRELAELDRAGIDRKNRELIQGLRTGAQLYAGKRVLQRSQPTPADVRIALGKLQKHTGRAAAALQNLDHESWTRLFHSMGDTCPFKFDWNGEPRPRGYDWIGTFKRDLGAFERLTATAIARSKTESSAGRPSRDADRFLAHFVRRVLLQADIECMRYSGGETKNAWATAIRICATLAGNPNIDVEKAWRGIGSVRPLKSR